MSEWQEFARADVPTEIGKCGHVLHFASQFKKFGQHRIEVCKVCKTVRHNDDAPTPLEVGPVT